MHTSSEENFRRLGLSIIILEEKLEEPKTYSQEMKQDGSKFVWPGNRYNCFRLI